MLLSGRRSGRRITDASRDQRRREGVLAADTSEAFSGIGLVQAYDLQEHRSQAFRTANDGSLRDGVRARRLAAGLERRVDVLVGWRRPSSSSSGRCASAGAP